MQRSQGRTFLYTLGALAGALLLWLLVEALLERRSIPDAERMALEQRASDNLEDMQRQLTQSLDGRTGNEAQARMDTPRGQALFRLCADWTEFHENHPSEETRRERDDACAQLKDYINNR